MQKCPNSIHRFEITWKHFSQLKDLPAISCQCGKQKIELSPPVVCECNLEKCHGASRCENLATIRDMPGWYAILSVCSTCRSEYRNRIS